MNYNYKSDKLITMKKELSTRAIIVSALIELAGDEYETTDDFVKMAKKSEQELIQDLIHVATYYKNLNDD
jgi:hypothetical protein